MTSQQILFILAHLILSNIAIPFKEGHQRRSLVSSLGDIGGQLRDESDNFESTAYGDSMLGGQYNKFIPVSTVNGIEGLSPLGALQRRTQVIGNTGSTRINRDESSDFISQTLGDSVNAGVGNAISPTSVVGGVTSGATGGLLGRRSQQIVKDGDTKLNRDESGNFYADTYGDSANQGVKNMISPDSFVGGVAHTLFRRSQQLIKDGDTRMNRDESGNFYTSTLGDALNPGIGNVVSPDSFVGGFADSLLRRSQQIVKDGSTKLNRDESGNFYQDTYGDAVSPGIGNVVSPNSVVGGFAGSFLRRSQQIIKDGDTKLNRDESGNFYSETLLDSLNSGIGNSISPQGNVGGPRSLLRRSQVIENDANVMINKDESANVYEETLQDSIGQGVGNSMNPMSIITGPNGGLGLLRRSQKVKFLGDMTINDDDSLNIATYKIANESNSGTNNLASPQATVSPRGMPLLKRRSPQGPQNPAESIIKSVMRPDNQGKAGVVLGTGSRNALARREDSYLITGTRDIKIDDSVNSYQVTAGDSVNQGMDNILQPLTQIGAPSGLLGRRSQMVSNKGEVMVNIDESTNGYTETLGDSANQGFFNNISPVSFISGPGLRRQRRDKILNNMNESVTWDKSVNNYGITYGDSVNAGKGNLINPQTLISSISGSALVGPRTAPPVGPLSPQA